MVKNAHHGCYDSAGYLLQLGFELVFKAWHLHEFGFFKNTHDLVKLIEELKSNKCSIEFDSNETETIKTVNCFYSLRYPRRAENVIEIGSDQVERFEVLLQSLWCMLPSELIDTYGEINRTGKDGRILMKKTLN